MARPRSIPDSDVFTAVRRILAEGGDKAVTFAAVALATGLAAPSLAQRYGTCAGMIRAALADGWAVLAAAVVPASGADTPQAFLKALGAEGLLPVLIGAGLRDSRLRAQATDWRVAVEAGLARFFGSGGKAREAAAALFAAWSGALLWEPAGGRGFKMKDAAKRLG